MIGHDIGGPRRCAAQSSPLLVEPVDGHQATAGMGVPPPADRHCLPTFSVSIRRKLRPSNARACTSLTFVFGRPRPLHSKQPRTESWARIANQNSLFGFLKAIVSDEAVTVDKRGGGLNHGINQQFEIRRNTVGRSPPRSAWPARTVHVRRYVRTRTAGRPLLSSWMRAMSGATADQRGERPSDEARCTR